MIEDLKLKIKDEDFIFNPTFIIKDKSKKDILYIRFNRKEKLVLYLTTDHPYSEEAANKLKIEFVAITKGYGEDWIVSDVMEYSKGIDNLKDKVRLEAIGLIFFNSGK